MQSVTHNNTLAYLLERQPARLALFTDIDDTLIDRGGNSAAIGAAHELRELLAMHSIPLIAVSGLEFPVIKMRIAAGEIPMPDAVVSAVGTDIWQRDRHGRWHQDTDYVAGLRATGYDYSRVLAEVREFMAALDPMFEATLQNVAPSPFKISLHFMACDMGAEVVAQQARAFFPNFKIITCKEIHYNAALPPDAFRFKHCLDIVPATKADAVAYLLKTYSIKGGWKAGDSGNDADMLLHSDPLIPIAVGGYKTELLRALRPAVTTGRHVYVEQGQRIAAQSIVHAVRVSGLIRRDVAFEDGE